MTRPRTVRMLMAIVMFLAIGASADLSAEDVESNLVSWLKGVWISGGGSYTIYTDNHYFVVSLQGDSASPNIYCGSSQLQFHARGLARKQVLRLRQFPGGEMDAWKQDIFTAAGKEVEFVIDTTLFQPGICNIVEGTIYDSITEETEEYILLATCNGDQIKVYANGVYAYLPKSGGEFRSYRVEKL